MPSPGWDREQTFKASKMWRAGDDVRDIAAAVGKEPQSIYGFARDNRELFPKRTRGARKKKVDPSDIPEEEYPSVDDLRPGSGRTIQSLKSAILINTRLAQNARKMGQPNAAGDYERVAELNRKELEIIAGQNG